MYEQKYQNKDHQEMIKVKKSHLKKTEILDEEADNQKVQEEIMLHKELVAKIFNKLVAIIIII